MASRAGAKLRRITTLQLLAGTLLFFGVCEAWHFGRSYSAVDFYQFWLGAHAIQRYGDSGFYSSDTRQKIARELAPEILVRQPKSIRRDAAGTMRREIEFAATPLLFAAFKLFASQSLEGSYNAFRAVSLIMGVMGILWLARISNYSGTVAVLAAALVVIFFEPLSSDLRVANVNLIQLAILGFALRLAAPRARRWLSEGWAGLCLGLVLGGAILFKPNLALAVAMILVIHLQRRAWRILGRMALGGALAAIIGIAWSSFAFRSATIWIEWWEAVRHSVPAMIPLRLGNYALSRIWIETIGQDPSLVLLAIVGVCSALVLWRAACDETSDAPLMAYAVAFGCLCYLIAAPLVWFHYYVLALPGILLVLRPAHDSTAAARVMIRYAGGIFALTLIALRPIVDAFGALEPWQGMAAINLGVVLLFATIVWDLAGVTAPQAGDRNNQA